MASERPAAANVPSLPIERMVPVPSGERQTRRLLSHLTVEQRRRLRSAWYARTPTVCVLRPPRGLSGPELWPGREGRRCAREPPAQLRQFPARPRVEVGSARASMGRRAAGLAVATSCQPSACCSANSRSSRHTSLNPARPASAVRPSSRAGTASRAVSSSWPDNRHRSTSVCRTCSNNP